VYLNDEDIRFLGGESCAIKDGDRVLLVPSIAGGAPAPFR
jgi:molybdopterin converting factor small subunit